MAGSILSDTKKALGLEEAYTPFDPDIVMHINSVLANLHQLGVGPEEGFAISSKTDTWDDFIGEELRLNNVQSYVYLKTKMLFDPPTIGYVLTAMEKMLLEAEWRLTVAQDEINVPPTPPVVEVVSTDLFE